MFYFDPWFYLTLLLASGYLTIAIIAYRVMKPFQGILRMYIKPGNGKVYTSTLRAKLDGTNDRSQRTVDHSSEDGGRED